MSVDIQNLAMNYENFANFMTNGKYSKMNDKDKLNHIFNTEEGLEIPSLRKQDYHWLLRNFMIRNKNHPVANTIMDLLKKIVKTA